ncbi:MAG: ATP-dependent RNA helicase RhlE [Phycisphaerales bacterium]|jgi:ATP-dependent RNA helicase RhlE
MSFTDLRLAEPIVRAVTSEGYTTPSPIQAQAIPVALEGRDILGCAQTGTGKTCAFALPILHRLMESNEGNRPARGRPPRAIVLAPTRELASQIFDSFNSYGRNLPLKHAVVYGGVSQHRQVRSMQNGVDVLVATPGRLHDLINQGYIDLSRIEYLVLDEADRMLDMGFINEIRKVVKMIPADHQTLLFSATVSREIRELSGALLRDPVTIETAPEATTIELITQKVYMVSRENKPHLLERLLGEEGVGRSLVFTKTKHGADKLVKVLNRAGINADAIHGNKSQNNRMRALQGFKSGKVRVLVATDIASRGIDVDDITHVVNYEMPLDPETYVHRIGRTARAGASGVAISFCDRDEFGLLRSVERRARIQIEVADDQPDLTTKGPPPMRRDRPDSHHSRKLETRKPMGRPGPRKPGNRPQGGRKPRYEGEASGEAQPQPQPQASGGYGGRPGKGPRAGKPDGNRGANAGPGTGRPAKAKSGPKTGPKAKSGGRPQRPGSGVVSLSSKSGGRSRKPAAS